MYPGSQGTFRFLVHNVGYDALDITAHPSNEFFTDFSCQFNGTTGMTDVPMTIPCNCNTSLVTFWVTPLALEQTAENVAPEIKVYPNPATDIVTIEAEGLETVTLTDINGKTLSSRTAKGSSISFDVSALKAGVYFISAKTRSTSSFVKSILKM